MATTEKTRIRLQDLHSAIESLALAQAEIGLAVMKLLAAPNQPLNAQESEDLYKRVDKAVDELHGLASKFLDSPYES